MKAPSNAFFTIISEGSKVNTLPFLTLFREAQVTVQITLTVKEHELHEPRLFSYHLPKNVSLILDRTLY